MCGICGHLVLDGSAGASPERIRSMLDLMAHRGPDDEGTFQDGPVAIAMRRLSIIDLETGHQPIFSEDRSAALVFSGEVYNYVELREDLIARGHRFASKSDAEVVVHLYEEKGPSCVKDLNGMFAFALWDVRKQQLMLARDRLGIKPLYYYVGGGMLLFASEMRALTANPEVPRELNAEAVQDYFTFWYIPGNQSIYRSVHKLPPAHTAVWHNSDCTQCRYWHLEYTKEKHPRPIEHYAERYKAQLARSVRLQLRSDVPVGVFLSGGLDSGSIVAAISRVLNRPCKTFTVGFADASYDESPEARLTAERYGTEHHEFRMHPQDMIKSAELMPHFGEPYGPFSLVQSYLISNYSRERIKVALAGDGGDELFGGYQTYIASRLARYYLLMPQWMRRRVFAPLAHLLPVSEKLMSLDFKIREFVRGAEMFRRGHNMAWKVIFTEDEQKELFTESFRESFAGRDAFAHIRDLEEMVAGASSLQKATYTDLTMFLADSVLTCTDRMSMAASQEVRVPILDHEMVEFAATVPDKYKCRGRQTKVLLRRALADWLPQEVLEKPKTGFTTPIPIWIRNELRDYVTDILAPSAIRRTGIINDDYVRRVLSEHISGKADHARRIWAVVNFMLWHETCYK